LTTAIPQIARQLSPYQTIPRESILQTAHAGAQRPPDIGIRRPLLISIDLIENNLLGLKSLILTRIIPFAEIAAFAFTLAWFDVDQDLAVGQSSSDLIGYFF
jgi:hypothetical protein